MRTRVMLSKLFETTSYDLPRLIPGDRADISFCRRFPLNILVAEDNYTSRRLLLLLLKNLGYEAQAVENGAECLQAIVDGSFDVLLTDLSMPEMSGIDVARALRREGFRIPIIAITATCPELTKEECLEAGMNGFMNKPVKLGEIKAALKEIALQKWVDERNLAALHA